MPVSSARDEVARLTADLADAESRNAELVDRLSQLEVSLERLTQATEAQTAESDAVAPGVAAAGGLDAGEWARIQAALDSLGLFVLVDDCDDQEAAPARNGHVFTSVDDVEHWCEAHGRPSPPPFTVAHGESPVQPVLASVSADSSLATKSNSGLVASAETPPPLPPPPGSNRTPDRHSADLDDDFGRRKTVFPSVSVSGSDGAVSVSGALSPPPDAGLAKEADQSFSEQAEELAALRAERDRMSAMLSRLLSRVPAVAEHPAAVATTAAQLARDEGHPVDTAHASTGTDDLGVTGALVSEANELLDQLHRAVHDSLSRDTASGTLSRSSTSNPEAERVRPREETSDRAHLEAELEAALAAEEELEIVNESLLEAKAALERELAEALQAAEDLELERDALRVEAREAAADVERMDEMEIQIADLIRERERLKVCLPLCGRFCWLFLCWLA